jgi:O-antigen/teichoic acid export membrane protein
VSFTLLLESFIGAPLDNAAVRFFSLHEESKSQVLAILKYVLKIKLFIFLCLFIGLVVYLKPITYFLLNDDAPIFALMVGLLNTGVLLAIRSNASSLQIVGEFSSYSRLDTLQGLFRLAFTMIVFASGSASIIAYLCALGLGTLCAFLVSFKFNQHAYLSSKPPGAEDRKLIFSFIGATSAIVALGSITGRADIPLLSMLSKTDPVGVALYSVAVQLAFTGTLLASYVAVVFQPQVVRMAKEKTLHHAINKNLLLVLALTIVCLPLAHLLSPLLIPLVFGESFIGSSAIFNILAIGVFADFVTMPILLPYAIQVLPKKIFVAETVLTLAFLISVIQTPHLSPEIMAWIVTAIRLAKMVVYYFLVTHSLRPNWLTEKS